MLFSLGSLGQDFSEKNKLTTGQARRPLTPTDLTTYILRLAQAAVHRYAYYGLHCPDHTF